MKVYPKKIIKVEFSDGRLGYVLELTENNDALIILDDDSRVMVAGHVRSTYTKVGKKKYMMKVHSPAPRPM